jgi:anti-sigma B factor antagonist
MERMLRITELDKDGVTVLALDGRIDMYGAVDLERFLQTAFALDRYHIVLDIATVSHISSAGVRVLAQLVALFRAVGGDLKLVGSNRRVMRVLRIIGFDQLFSSYLTLDAAIADCLEAGQPVAGGAGGQGLTFAGTLAQRPVNAQASLLYSPVSR